MTRLQNITNRVLAIVGSAMILMFFSEFFFLNEGPVNTVMSLRSDPASAIVGLIETTCYYAVASWAFLLLLPSARKQGMAGLFLAACLYGWITEGAIVPVVHEAPPISWIWTSVSWHVPIDVFLGLFILRHAMGASNAGASILLHALAGIGWGVWSTWTWGEPDSLRISGVDFLFFAAVTSAIWTIGLVLLSRAQMWKSTQRERWGVFSVVWIFALMWASAALPFSLGPLGLGVLSLWLVVRRGQSAARSVDMPMGPFPLDRLWHVGLAALVATSTVWLFDSQGWNLPTEETTWVFFLFGLGALLWAYWRVFTLR